MLIHHALRKFFLVYSTHLNKEEYTQFVMALPAYECTFWIAHQFNENGEPVTHVLLDFGLMGFQLPTFDVFQFQGFKPSHHRTLDSLNAINWRRFLCRFGRDETCPLKLVQPWFTNALVYIRRQNITIKQTDIFNLYSPSGQAHLRQFSAGVQQFYAADTVLLYGLSQLQQLTKRHRSIIIHLSKHELEQEWIHTSTVLQQLRTGQVTGHIPQSLLLLSKKPIRLCGGLIDGRIDLLNLDTSSLLCND